MQKITSDEVTSMFACLSKRRLMRPSTGTVGVAARSSAAPKASSYSHLLPPLGFHIPSLPGWALLHPSSPPGVEKLTSTFHSSGHNQRTPRRRAWCIATAKEVIWTSVDTDALSQGLGRKAELPAVCAVMLLYQGADYSGLPLYSSFEQTLPESLPGADRLPFRFESLLQGFLGKGLQ